MVEVRFTNTPRCPTCQQPLPQRHPCSCGHDAVQHHLTPKRRTYCSTYTKSAGLCPCTEFEPKGKQ